MNINKKNIIIRNMDFLGERILRSMIASFKIENVYISEKAAQEIYQRVRKNLKK